MPGPVLTEGMEQRMLKLLRDGKSPRVIALALGVGRNTVYRGLAAAREREREADRAGPRRPADPSCFVIWPMGPYTPTSPCGHKGPIREGSEGYCPRCHQYGREYILHRDRRPMPPREAEIAKRKAQVERERREKEARKAGKGKGRGKVKQPAKRAIASAA